MSAHIEWQAYLDGTLTASERRSADAVLRESAAARQELEGLRGFIGHVAEAARAEEVPTARLEAFIPRPTPLMRYSRPIGFAFVVAATVMIWFAVFVDPMRLDRSPSQDRIPVREPAKATELLARHTGINVPPIKLSKAKLCAVEYGDGWGSMVFHCKRDAYTLYVAAQDAPFLSQPTVYIGKNPLYMAQGVGWVQNGIAYYLKGPDKSLQIQLASEAMKQTATATPPRAFCETGR